MHHAGFEGGFGLSVTILCAETTEIWTENNTIVEGPLDDAIARSFQLGLCTRTWQSATGPLVWEDVPKAERPLPPGCLGPSK